MYGIEVGTVVYVTALVCFTQVFADSSNSLTLREALSRIVNPKAIVLW
jgi:hypothetical protein